MLCFCFSFKTVVRKSISCLVLLKFCNSFARLTYVDKTNIATPFLTHTFLVSPGLHLLTLLHLLYIQPQGGNMLALYMKYLCREEMHMPIKEE